MKTPPKKGGAVQPASERTVYSKTRPIMKAPAAAKARLAALLWGAWWLGGIRP